MRHCRSFGARITGTGTVFVVHLRPQSTTVCSRVWSTIFGRGRARSQKNVCIYKPTREPWTWFSCCCVAGYSSISFFSHFWTIGQRRFHVTLVCHHVPSTTGFFSTSLCTDLRNSRNYTRVRTCTTDANLEICVSVTRSGTSARKPGRCLIRWQYFVII